ncbi:MAG: 1-(5-phosphoribosyl)-5-[(5-phosphoribosylamino)methylideneamino]imidazole-4-carboxamide isomerase [Sphaerochaetaceae bacterium]|nr:1-(5-phosphoribosyl)-5-[(5-phosphoribosylamino)methylideneamino]imidazole-4-carboxamide isomerase [Sphaerochaetaceae bacterium]
MRIIPAIDIIAGEAVRLTKGDYSTRTVYYHDPLEAAKAFEGAGLERLHLVDLEGAKAGHIVNIKTLERIASKTTLVIDFGGGVKSTEELERAFNAGASQVTCGSIAIKDRELVLSWLEKFGPERLILGADCRNGMVSASGWLEDSTLEVTSFIDSYHKKGMVYCISTDIAKDGMLMGPSVDLYKKILEKEPGLKLIASGGVSCVEDLYTLKEAGLFGAIVGKAFYENRITLSELGEVNSAS